MNKIFISKFVLVCYNISKGDKYDFKFRKRNDKKIKR